MHWPHSLTYNSKVLPEVLGVEPTEKLEKPFGFLTKEQKIRAIILLLIIILTVQLVI